MNPARVREYFDRYTYKVGLEHGVTSLYQAYNRCSDSKKAAWTSIKLQAAKDEGRFVSVITHGRQYYTAGYYYIKDKEYYFKVFTASDTGVLHLGQNDILELKKQGML